MPARGGRHALTRPLHLADGTPHLGSPLRRAELGGMAVLAPRELLELWLGADARRGDLVAWLQRLEGWGLLADARPSELGAYGLSAQRAARLLAGLEWARRRCVERTAPRPGRPLDASAVAEWAWPRLAGLHHEEVWILCLDGRTSLRSAWQVARGGLHGCSLLPRDVLVPVVRQAASAFVLVHNHPSGDPSPSQEDRELTHALARAAALVGSPLLDHVVVAGRRFTSLAQREPGLFLV